MTIEVFTEKLVLVWMILVCAYALRGFVGTFITLVREKERK